jgi:hypothetical protein
MHFKKIEFRQLSFSNLEKKKTLSISFENLYRNHLGIEWKNNNKELVINGVYHEVIAIIKNNSSANVIVIADNEENNLFQRFFTNGSSQSNDFLSFFSFINLSFFEECSRSIVYIHDFFLIMYRQLPVLKISSLNINAVFRPPII